MEHNFILVMLSIGDVEHLRMGDAVVRVRPQNTLRLHEQNTSSVNQLTQMSLLKSLNLIGSTGRSYSFKKLIQERPHLGRVWLASFEQPAHVADLSNRLILSQIWQG